MSSLDPASQRSPDASLAVTMQELILGAWLSQAITTVVDLGVADALAGGPLQIEELAGRVGADSDALNRLLRALSSRGIFTQRESGFYELTPLAQFLRCDVPVSMAAMSRLIGSRQHREHWSLLTKAIKTGATIVPEIRGMNCFDYLREDPEFGRIFNDAMTSFSEVSIRSIVGAHSFTDYRTIVDVGGGHGRLLAAILASAPDAQGVLYDLPEVIAGAMPVLQKNHVAQRVRLVEGSFFDAVPAGGDVYVLKAVVHDWDDDAAARILCNVRDAVDADTVLLLIERVVFEGNNNAVASLIDIEMLLTNNGRERTAEEFHRLLSLARFEVVCTVEAGSGVSVIEARAV